MDPASELDSLPERLSGRARLALERGALETIDTECVHLEQAGIHFVVRVLASLGRKRLAGARPDPDFDPFLPYDPELFVADVSATHVALLNKFCVVECHLLIVTRAFEEQQAALTAADFGALHACMLRLPGLAFYNSGSAAGASQRHKHLQLIRPDLDPEGSGLPIAAAISRALTGGEAARLPQFPFRHALARLEAFTPAALMACYQSLRRSLQLDDAGPYNLLATSGWMLMVPRRRERSALTAGGGDLADGRGISVNALGFAGGLLVRDRAQLELVRAAGPIEVLRSVAVE